VTDAGSGFQTDGAAHRKECFAKSVRANGWMSSGVAVKCRLVSIHCRKHLCSAVYSDGWFWVVVSWLQRLFCLLAALAWGGLHHLDVWVEFCRHCLPLQQVFPPPTTRSFWGREEATWVGQYQKMDHLFKWIGRRTSRSGFCSETICNIMYVIYGLLVCC